jgi:hypothetical protein
VDLVSREISSSTTWAVYFVTFETPMYETVRIKYDERPFHSVSMTTGTMPKARELAADTLRTSAGKGGLSGKPSN